MSDIIAIRNREYLARMKEVTRQRFFVIGGLFLSLIFERMILKVSFSAVLFFLTFLLFLLTFPAYWLFERSNIQNIKIVVDIYFFYLLFELIILTLVVYFAGGITWVAPALYLFYAITVFWFFPSGKAIFLVIYMSLLLIVLVSLQYFGILGQPRIFSIEEARIQNFPYFFSTTVIILAVLGYLGYSSNIFFRLLSRKIEKLRNAEGKLKKAKNFLEREAEQRTKELTQEKENLEDRVREKTAELEEEKRELELKVSDLEKVYRVAVDRELKIAELKKKIIDLKKGEK